MTRRGIRRFFRIALRRESLRERDVDDEIRLHIELRAEQLVRAGLSPEAARVEAQRRFGALTVARPRLLDAARQRDTHMTWSDRLDGVRHDLVFAARQLRAAPGVTTAAVVTLALGIGANATMFGIVDRLLFRAPAYVADADHVTRFYVERRHAGFGGGVTPSVSYPAYAMVRDSAHALAGVAAYYGTNHVVGEGDRARQRPTVEATGNYFTLLGVRPALGRFFGPDDDRVPAGTRVAVLGDRYWRQEFGASREIIGHTLVVEGQRYQIVGVAPRGFTGVDLAPVDVFLPVSAIASDTRGREWHDERGMAWLAMVARVRPGVARGVVESDATRALAHTAPDSTGPSGFDYGARVVAASVIPAREPVRSDRRTSASIAGWLAGVAAIVLLIACANVANLLLARAVRRRREIAVRAALGAGRWRLVRQLLTESTLLALLGGVAGLALARWGGAAIRAALLPDVEWSPAAAIDARVLVFALGATTLTALLTGLAPVLQLTASRVSAGLRTGAREGGGRRARSRTALLVAQAALSVVLLAGAGLFVRSLRRISALDFGFDAARVLVVDPTFADGLSRDAQWAAVDRMLDAARRVPGVERAAITTSSPFWTMVATPLSIPGHEETVRALGDERPSYNAVGPDYFASMGTRIVRGRAFGAGDAYGAPRVAIVNEEMARRIWKGADPVGQCIKVRADTVPCSEIVGVARTTVYGELRERPMMQYYIPAAQRQTAVALRGIVVRAAGDAAEARALVPTLRRALAAAAPEARYVDVVPLAERIDPQVRPWRLGATMFGAFGVLALLIAAVGLYSVLAYTVAQRLHEMGLRMALGARARDVVSLVVRQGLGVAVVGVALGTGAALVAARWVAPLLFDVSARDPLVYGGVAATLLGAALAATVVPARRATRVAPSDALRSE